LPALSPEKRMWIHALSVGEVLSAVSLVEEIKREFPFQLIFTVTTKKGMEVASKNLKEKVELITSPSTERLISVTSSGLSSMSNIISITSG
jgi:3-deoxy-D-manno-octulosonic-acid transferase